MMYETVEVYISPVRDVLSCFVPLIGMILLLVLIISIVIKLHHAIIFKMSDKVLDRECVMPWADYEVLKNEMEKFACEGSKNSISRS